MNSHYRAVLSDLRQMKADAEAGIVAIERLMSSEDSEKTGVPESAETDSMPLRVLRFFSSTQGETFSVEDIIDGAGMNSKPRTVRGAINRLHKAQKIERCGRGRYRIKG